MCHQGTHAARLGKRQRRPIVGLAALGIEAVEMGRDVPEQVQGMGRETGMRQRGFCLVAIGQIQLRRIDGWRKIATALRQHTVVAA